MSLFKSNQRVADHGEVFTSACMLEAMLDVVKGETERIDSRLLEPGVRERDLPRPDPNGRRRPFPTTGGIIIETVTNVGWCSGICARRDANQ